MTYLLIAILYNGNIFTQEFTNKQNCETAKAMIIIASAPRKINVGCTLK